MLALLTPANISPRIPLVLHTRNRNGKMSPAGIMRSERHRKISKNNCCLCYRLLGTGVERYALPVLLSLSVASLMLYEDYLDNRLCSRLDYGRCCWRINLMHEAKSQSLVITQYCPNSSVQAFKLQGWPSSVLFAIVIPCTITESPGSIPIERLPEDPHIYGS